MPLLSLGADQVNKLISTTTGSDNTITALHLDDVPSNHLQELVELMQNYHPLKTIILFASPQSLLKERSPVLPYLISDACKLSMIVMDEIHLVTHFGMSFRKEFGALKNSLFKKVRNRNVPLLFLTATCTSRIKESLESMLDMRINYVHWPSPLEMVNRNVKLNITYSTKWLHSIKQSLKSNLTGDPELPTKVIIYSNQRTKILSCADNIETFLDGDELLCDMDVIRLVGTLHRDEKTELINMFLDDSEGSNSLNILCATSGVGNAGIDSPNIRAVYRIDFPPSILDICQERGRAGRRPDATDQHYSYNLTFSLESFIHIFKRIHDKEEAVIDERYRKEQEDDLFHVAKLFSSHEVCLYVAFEQALGNPDGDQTTADPCYNCPNCSGEYIFPALNKDGVREVLFNLLVSADSPIRTMRTWETVSDAMRKFPDINEKLFQRRAKNVQRVDIMKCLFILISYKILKIEYEDGNIYIGAAKSEASLTELAYNDDNYWSGIRLID